MTDPLPNRRDIVTAAAGSPEAFNSFIEPAAGHALSPAMWDGTRTWFKRHL